MTSPDGINWTAQNSGFPAQNFLGVSFGNSLYVAVGTNGTIITSSDGVTWTITEITFRIAGTADGESSPLTIQSVTLSDEQTNDIQTTGSNGTLRTTATIPAMSVTAMILLTVLLACTIFYSVHRGRRSSAR